ncbi:MAG TPA: glycosyltransferase family 1 protein [Gaiellaceae bacterium]|nr:glycosyltransferase family 1 protein [Gaiellaceae bacterium]
MSALVVVDADVLGRRRTGDEAYVENLLRELVPIAGDLRIAAVTRKPGAVPDGIEAVELPATSQATRMAWRLPRLLRELKPDVAHFLHVLPPLHRGPSVLTVQDLSFETDRKLMGARDRLIFRTQVRPSSRRAARVLTGSTRTRDDLVDRYGIDPAKIRLTPYGVDPAFTPDGPAPNSAPYALFVGALHARKDPLAAVEALALLSGQLRLTMVGPDKGLGETVRAKSAQLGVGELVDLRGHVAKDELAALYRGARCLVFPSRYEGFGLPIVEAMASGTPVVTTAAGATTEVAGDAAVIVEPGNPCALAGGIERALADRERLVAAGLARAQRYSWGETARLTLAAYHELL